MTALILMLAMQFSTLHAVMPFWLWILAVAVIILPVERVKWNP